MAELSAHDISVVIPTVGRGPILSRTLDRLVHQTVEGHEVIVVVDGEQADAALDALHQRDDIRLLRKPHGGPGAARNHGVEATDRPLVLFLGDDMVPTEDLVARHVARHGREPEANVAVLGRVHWHPEVAGNHLLQWMDWSGTQFDFDQLDRERRTDAGYGRFYSCNVSLKRELFDRAGGFDEAFTFYYEDLDLGWRLAQEGMLLRYEPAAAVHHLHDYDWPAVVRRFEGIARGERLMAAKHEWFEPWFKRRLEAAQRHRPVTALWPRLVERVPARPEAAVRLARGRANRWYHQQLAEPFLRVFDGEDDLADLKCYLGDAFDEQRLFAHAAEVEREEESALDEATFYRTSEAYLYDLTAFAMSGTKLPYHRVLRSLLPPGSSLLDYGCGIGSDGLRLLDAGYRVSFADFDNPSTRYLRWRLDRRGADAGVFDLDGNVPGGFDAAYSFDVIEHVDDPFAFLGEMEARADLVVVNLLEPDPADTHLHRPLPIAALLAHAARHRVAHYGLYHRRSHLVAYRTRRSRRVSDMGARAKLSWARLRAR